MILDSFKLTGKVAIVTGADTGLGQGMALACAEAGADVVGVSIVPCTETKAQVEALGRKFVEVVANLSKPEEIDKVMQIALNSFGKIDILFNNAGIIKRNDAIDFTLEEWDSVMDINIRAVFYFSQAVAKQFIKQGEGGKIINTASMLSFQGGIRVPSYTSSKSAVKGLTMALANEWAKYGICVNAIAPGYMETNNTTALRADPVRNKAILERIPANRWGTPQDLKGIAVFLASSASDYINGYTIAVDGGWLAR